jgi:hypothetical protein
MLTGTPRRAWSAAWALLLALWVAAAWSAQSGFSSSGPMNIHWSPGFLVVISIPVSVLAPWAALKLGARLHRAAASMVVALTCWWQFWLPATMRDIGYSVRYDIPDPYIWPGTPGSAALALSVALWLFAPLAQWTGRRCLVSGAVGAASTAAAVLALDGADWSYVPWPTALGGVVGIIVLVAARHRMWPAYPMLRWLSLWCAGMLGLIVFWFVTEAVAGWVPHSVNGWFTRWLYS